MAGSIKGITIEFNGEDKGLKSVMKNLNKEARTLDGELKQIDKSLKFNPTNVSLWSQKQKVLTDEVKASETRLKGLKDAQAQLDARKVDQSSEEYRSLEREIIKCENQLKGYKKELNSIPSARLKALSEGFKKVGSAMTSAGKELTTKVTAPIVAAYTLAAKLGSDYEENLNKIGVAFGDSSEAVTEWANNARKQFGLSKVQATGAVSAFGALGKGIGLTEKDAADMSTTLAGLSADLGSYFNTGTDESAKALEGIFTGESEALKKFGVVMNETNLKKFAEDQGLVYSEMSQTEKTMLRYNFVLAQTGDAQGDFARTSDGTANSTKMFQAAVQDLGTAIGTQLLPIITPVIQKVTDIIAKFAELPEPVQKVITIVGLVAAVLGPLLLIIGSIASAIGSIMSLAPVIMGAIGGVAGTLLPIIGIIAGVVAAGILLYKNWGKIKEYAIKLKDWLVNTWTNIKTSIVTAVTNLKTSLVNLWTNIKTSVSNIVTSIKNFVIEKWNSLKTGVVNFVTQLKNGVVALWNGLKIGIQNIVISIAVWVLNKFNALKHGVTTTISNLKNGVINLWNGLKERIRSIVSSVATWISNKFQSIKTGVVNTVTNLKNGAVNIFSSLVNSAKAKFNAVKTAILTPIQNARDKVKAIVDRIKGFFSGMSLKLPHIKLPHFSITGKLSLTPPSVPKLSISWYKNGGIFQNPTVFSGVGVGEAGAEAVLPLKKLWEEMDKRFGSGDNIVINVYGSSGMDVNELALEVQRRLITIEKRRRNAWAY